MRPITIVAGNTKAAEIEETLTTVGESCKLVLWNDDVHTFDFVIESLVDVCGLDSLQAEQLAMLVHYKGKATVREGDEPTLEPMCLQLIQKELTAEIQK